MQGFNKKDTSTIFRKVSAQGSSFETPNTLSRFLPVWLQLIIMHSSCFEGGIIAVFIALHAHYSERSLVNCTGDALSLSNRKT